MGHASTLTFRTMKSDVGLNQGAKTCGWWSAQALLTSFSALNESNVLYVGCFCLWRCCNAARTLLLEVTSEIHLKLNQG